jgi:uncharacterized protein with gpF-like domain
MTVNEIALQYDRFYRKYEKKYEKKISREIRRQITTYLDTKDITSVNAERMTKIIRELHLDVGYNWARMQRTQKSRFSDYMFPLLRTYMIMDALNAGEEITQTTIDYIKDLLYQATILNWSLDMLRRELLRVQYIRARGLLIARTELTYSSNLATYVLFTNNQTYRYKRWVALLDGRTRRDHRILNGDVKSLNEPFTVVNKRGVTVQMMYPGDRSLGAGPDQICNCRCFLIYE